MMAKNQRTDFKLEIEMLPLSLLESAYGQTILAELKSGETINGTLKNSDKLMNIMLTNVVCTSKDGTKFWKISESYLRGTSLKYVRLPNETLEKAREEATSAANGSFRGEHTHGRGQGFRGGRGGRGGNFQRHRDHNRMEGENESQEGVHPRSTYQPRGGRGNRGGYHRQEYQRSNGRSSSSPTPSTEAGSDRARGRGGYRGRGSERGGFTPRGGINDNRRGSGERGNYRGRGRGYGEHSRGDRGGNHDYSQKQ